MYDVVQLHTRTERNKFCFHLKSFQSDPVYVFCIRTLTIFSVNAFQMEKFGGLNYPVQISVIHGENTLFIKFYSPGREVNKFRELLKMKKTTKTEKKRKLSHKQTNKPKAIKNSRSLT